MHSLTGCVSIIPYGFHLFHLRTKPIFERNISKDYLCHGDLLLEKHNSFQAKVPTQKCQYIYFFLLKNTRNILTGGIMCITTSFGYWQCIWKKFELLFLVLFFWMSSSAVSKVPKFRTPQTKITDWVFEIYVCKKKQNKNVNMPGLRV